MTTPVVLAVSEALANGVTSLDVPTPTGTASGDLLLVIVAVDATTASTSMIGFTALYENEVSETFITASAYYRIADGTEGANLTVTLSGAEDIVARAYRIDGYSGVPEVEFVSTGNSTTQTSPPITPSGGSADYLYLVFDHIDTANGLINTFPTGYAGVGSVANARCRLGYGVKSTIATTSETPTDWVLSATRRTVTSTIAISPVSGGGSGVTVGADIEISKPEFSISGSVTFPQASSSIGLLIASPIFSVNSSITVPQPKADSFLVIQKPVFSIEAVATQPLPVADINFNISKPIFSIMATVTGLDIIVGSNAKLAVNFESNKLTLKTQSNYLKV